MKALSKLHKKPGIWMIEAETLNKNDLGHNEVLIKIKKTAICGTDLHIYNWDDWAQKTIPAPMITGHEFVGEIAAVGTDVKHFNIGDRVSGEGHIVCGVCRSCRAGTRHLCRETIGVGVTRQGCFAEYLIIPAENAFHVPDNISDDVASIFDPLGNAVHTTLAFNLIGEDVLITGAGPIGIMAVAIAKHVGARNVVITDINDYRLDMARKMGATKALNIKDQDQIEALQNTMNELGMIEGFDVGLEMSGNHGAINAMIKTLRHGGKISALGVTNGEPSIAWNDIVFHGLELKGIYGREMYETWYKMIAMLDSGLDISSIITHHFNVDDFEQGFQTMKSGQCGKVILDWQK